MVNVIFQSVFLSLINQDYIYAHGLNWITAVLMKNSGLSTTFLKLKNTYSLLHLDARFMIP
jgi:hypothetical protein